MSRWSEEFDNHPIHALLDRAISNLGTVVEDTNAELENERRRLSNTLTSLVNVIDGLDREFFPIQWINELSQQLDHPNFVGQLNAFSAIPDTSNLVRANDHITSSASTVYLLVGSSSPERAGGTNHIIDNTQKVFVAASEAMERAANKTKQSFDQLQNGFQDLTSRTETIEEDLKSLAESARSKLQEWELTFSENEATRLTENSTAKTDREQEFKRLVGEWAASLDEKRESLTEHYETTLRETLANLKQTGAEILADIETKHEEVKEAHKLVGDDSVAGGYQKSAGEEKREANRWRLVSLVCLAAAVIWLLIKYKSGFSTEPLNWPEITTTASITAILILAASYTSRQSKMHRDNEKLLRSYALETKALDPFISGLDTTQQQNIKAELVRRMFGQQQTVSGKEPKVQSSDSEPLEPVVRSIGDRVSQIWDFVRKQGD